MTNKIAINVNQLGKQYQIGSFQEQYRTLRDTIVDLPKGFFKRFTHLPQDNGFWALKDVSFNVTQGEVVGIIGRNGAGKSTLLKILSRITSPTEGSVEIHGRVGSLLEVGTGFHPELTGRENIFLSGSILGMKKRDIKQKFDEIVKFSEIEKFIDTPVKRYSSGMYVRLAFAVAAHLEPEILIVDEVLAVGDTAFQKKCLGKMGDVAREGRTILFVSHNMDAIQSLCSKVILIDHGKISKEGDVRTIISNYLNFSSQEIYQQKWEDTNNAPGNKNVRLLKAEIMDYLEGDRQITIETPIKLHFVIFNYRSDIPFHFNILLHTEDGVWVFNTASSPTKFPEGIVEATCLIPGNFLNNIIYFVNFYVHYEGSEGLGLSDVLKFEVYDIGRDEWGWYGEWVGVTRPKLDWTVNFKG